jgi:hypothetical protein
MTVRNPPVRRPRRANSLKDIGRLLGFAGTSHEEDRKDRLLAKVRKLSDTAGNARSNYFKVQDLGWRRTFPSPDETVAKQNSAYPQADQTGDGIVHFILNLLWDHSRISRSTYLTSIAEQETRS